MTKLAAHLASIWISEFKFTGRMFSRDAEKECVFVELLIYDLYFEDWSTHSVFVEELDEVDYKNFQIARKLLKKGE